MAFKFALIISAVISVSFAAQPSDSDGCQFYVNNQVMSDNYQFRVQKSENIGSQPVKIEVRNADSIELLNEDGGQLPYYFDMVQSFGQVFLKVNNRLDQISGNLRGTLQCMTADGEAVARDFSIVVDDRQNPNPNPIEKPDPVEASNGCDFYMPNGAVMPQNAELRLSVTDPLGSRKIYVTARGADAVEMQDSEYQPLPIGRYIALSVGPIASDSRLVHFEVSRNLQEVIQQFGTNRMYGSLHCITNYGDSNTKHFSIVLGEDKPVEPKPTTKRTTPTTKPTPTPTTTRTIPTTTRPRITTTVSVPKPANSKAPKFNQEKYHYKIDESQEVDEFFVDLIGVSGAEELQFRISNGDPDKTFKVTKLPTNRDDGNKLHKFHYRLLLSLTKPLNFKKKNHYVLTIEAQDKKNELKTTANIVVDVIGDISISLEFSEKSYFAVVTKYHLDADPPVELPVVFPSEIKLKNNDPKQNVNFAIVDDSPIAECFDIQKRTGVLFLINPAEIKAIKPESAVLTIQAYLENDPEKRSEVTVNVSFPAYKSWSK